MAEKRYHWLKLKVDFFAEKEIKKLRKIAGGDTYTIIYLKLQLLSVKNHGKIYFEGIEKTFEEEMALALDEDVENIKMTLIFLKNHGCLEMLTDEEYILPKTIGNIGSESASAERVRKYRDSKNLLHCNDSVTNCNVIERREEKDKNREDLEKEKETEKEEKNSVIYSISPEKFYSQNFGPIGSLIAEYIKDYADWGMEDSLITEAMKIAIEKNIRKWSYVDGILKNMQNAGFKTFEQYEAHEAERKRKEMAENDRNGKSDRKDNGDDGIVNKGITRI